MSCKVQVFSPNTGEIVDSQTWLAINNEVLNENYADELFRQTRTENFKAWFGDVYKQGESHSQIVDSDGAPLLVYHSSMKEFETFDLSKSTELGFHFGTKRSALERHFPGGLDTFDNIDLQSAIDDLKEETKTFNIKPFFINLRNMIEGVDYLESENIPNNISESQFKLIYKHGAEKFSDEFTRLVMAFHFKGLITYDQLEEIFDSGDKTLLRKYLGNPDGYWYRNMLEHSGQISYVVFDPKNIKSLYNNGDYSEDENTMYNLDSELTNQELSEEEVNSLIGGFVKYGTLNQNDKLSNLKQQGYYKSIPEEVLGALSKRGILSRLIRNLEDRWYFVRGLDFQQENIENSLAKYTQFMSMNNLNQDMFLFENTKGDEAPYLRLNEKFNFEDTIQENNQKIKKEKYEAIIQFFQDKFGIKKEQIVYTSKEQFKKDFPQAYQENMQSVYSNGKFYFFTRNLTSDITVEELLHPFIYTVKELNPALFDNLLKEATKHYPKLNAKIQALYAKKSKSVRDQELVTQALSRVFNNVYENEEPQSFLNTVKDFVNWLRSVMQDIFNSFSTGKSINIPIDKLPIQTSLYEIAKLLNATDTQFDVIYPGEQFYSLEENTISYNKNIEAILTDSRVATKINEIFVKIPKTIKEFKNKLNNTINKNEKQNLQAIIKNIEELDNEDNQNIIAFQLKGIIASVQLTNQLIKNLTAMKNSDNDDNIKLAYYMSVHKTAKAMDGFRDLIIELKRELTSNLVLSNTLDISNFVGQLTSAISAEEEITEYIQELIKAPLMDMLVESNEYVYSPKLQKLKSDIDILEKEISSTGSQPQKDVLYRKLSKLKTEFQEFLKTAPTRENLQKQFNGEFKDANILSHIFEAKIANGSPLVATLQNIINNIYDNANRNMLNSKNKAQEMMDRFTKETGIGLRDQQKRYEQIMDLVSIPTDLILDENKNPVLDDQNNHQFRYVEQDTLLSNIDNSYITQYLELQMIKDFYLDKHRENRYNNKVDDAVFAKYRAVLKDFQEFVDKNSQKEYKPEIYEYKAILNEVIGGKTLREITSDYYNQLDDAHQALERATDTIQSLGIIEMIKDINIELKRLKTIYKDNGEEKTGDELKIAELLSKYNKLRGEYNESGLTDSARQRYEFDLQELENKKEQYLADGNEETYLKNLSRIQQEVISPDYFTALSDISEQIDELTNILNDSAIELLPEHADSTVFKKEKRDIYKQLKELSKPYRDENGVVDGIAMLKRHPEVGIQIRDLQQYLEDLKKEISKIGYLSKVELDEISVLLLKEDKSTEEKERLESLLNKKETFSQFRKINNDLIKDIEGLYDKLGNLTATYTTDYFDKAIQQELNKIKLEPNTVVLASEFIAVNPVIAINGVSYRKGGENRDANIWYREQKLGKISEFIPLNSKNTTGYNEILDIVSAYYANLIFKESDWWKNNHYKKNKFDKESKTFTEVDTPIYIWEHQTPRNPNFIEIKPSKEYSNFSVEPKFINSEYDTTYRGIPIPISGKFVNERYSKLNKRSFVFEFLDYFTKDYLEDQGLYEAKGNSVKMGHVLPSVIKTEGENQVNTTNKLLSFDGTFAQMFKSNVSKTDDDTSYLVGGSQSNNKTIPIRFVGKIDTKAQTKNIVASLLLFKYHSSLYKSLNDSLPLFEASQILASNVDVLESKNYADKLSFTKRVFNFFSPKKRREEETSVKNIEKSVLSKSVDDVLDIFVYGQRMKPQILNLGPLGTVDLAKVSSGILGFAAKSIFIGNIFSAINNSLSTRIQMIVNLGVKGDLYKLENIRNAQAKVPKYTKDLLSDWTKLGNKSLVGQVLDYFAFTNENPSREITSKAEFTMLKNKLEFLTSPKQMSEYEVLFLQFLTMADATPLKINGKITKLSNIEEIFEIKDGKFQKKAGVEFTEEQEKVFRGRYQAFARKVAGAYRTTEISNIETNWAGKSGMFLRRYFVSLATNRFQGTRFSFQEGDNYIGYQREVMRNMIHLFTEYKGNFIKYYDELSDREKAAHVKMLAEYGILLVLIGLFSILGGDDPKKELKKNSWAYNVGLVALLRAKSELQQFTAYGVDDLIRVGKNPFMVFQTLGNVTKTIWLIKPTIFGDESAYYQQNSGLHDKGDSKLLATFLKTIGYTGVTFHPEEYNVNLRNAQNR